MTQQYKPGDAGERCTCLTELEDDAYGPGGPMSGKPKPPPCKVHRPTPTAEVTGEDVLAKLRCVISHATGGMTADTSLSLNDICVRITQHRNEVYTTAQARGVKEGLEMVTGVLRQTEAALGKALIELQSTWGTDEGDDPELLNALAAIRALGVTGKDNNNGS